MGKSMKPKIQSDTIEKLTDAVNGEATIDDMVLILKTDTHWRYASTEQCEKFLAELLTSLNEV
jgi:hypothetical protein